MLTTTGERIRARRKALGLSAEELAPQVGKSVPTFYHYEQCDYDKIPSHIIDKLAPLLKTSVAYLTKMTDDSFPVDTDHLAADYFEFYTTTKLKDIVYNPNRPRHINMMRIDGTIKKCIDKLTADDMQNICSYIEFLASRHQIGDDEEKAPSQ